MIPDLKTVVVYTDDVDASVRREVTSLTGEDLTGTPKVAADDGPYDITATWVGTVGPVRDIRVPVHDLEAGRHKLYLEVDGFNDLYLGEVLVQDRT